MFDFELDAATGRWESWASQTPEWTYPAPGSAVGLAQSLVTTPDCVRYNHLIRLIHAAGKPAMIVGAAGTGKTTLARQCLASGGPESASKELILSHLTTPHVLQSSLERCLERRQGRSFGPPTGRVLSLLIDDVNMPATNDWGDQVRLRGMEGVGTCIGCPSGHECPHHFPLAKQWDFLTSINKSTPPPYFPARERAAAPDSGAQELLLAQQAHRRP